MAKCSTYPTGDINDATSRLLGVDTNGGDDHDELRTVTFDLATVRQGVGWTELSNATGPDDEWTLDLVSPLSGTWTAENVTPGEHQFHQADDSGTAALVVFAGTTGWNISDSIYRFGLDLPSGATGRAGLTWAGFGVDGLALIDGAPFVAFERIDDSTGTVVVGRLNESDDYLLDNVGFPQADNFAACNIYRNGAMLGVSVSGTFAGPAGVVPMLPPSSAAVAVAVMPTLFTVDQEARFGGLLTVLTPASYGLLS